MPVNLVYWLTPLGTVPRGVILNRTYEWGLLPVLAAGTSLRSKKARTDRLTVRRASISRCSTSVRDSSDGVIGIGKARSQTTRLWYRNSSIDSGGGVTWKGSPPNSAWVIDRTRLHVRGGFGFFFSHKGW